MDITLNKKARIPAGIITAILLILTVLDGKVFFEERFFCDVLLYVLCFIASVIIGILILYDFKI